MDWKKFFKPTIAKIILFIIIFLILPAIDWLQFQCEGCPPGIKCPACGGEYQLIFFGIPFLIGRAIFHPTWAIADSHTALILPLNIILNIVISYIFSCFIIQLYKRIKKQDTTPTAAKI
jgi:hypothetical protein